MMYEYFEKSLSPSATFMGSASVKVMEGVLDKLALRQTSLAGKCYSLSLAKGNGVKL